MRGPEVVLGTLPFDTDQAVTASEDNYVLTYDDADGQISLEPIPTQNPLVVAGNYTIQVNGGENAFVATANGSTALYFDNVLVAGTLAAASGGLQVNNTLTGSGLKSTEKMLKLVS